MDSPGRYVTADVYFDGIQVVLKEENSAARELEDVLIKIETIVNGVPGRSGLREIASIGARSLEDIETGISFRGR